MTRPSIFVTARTAALAMLVAAGWCAAAHAAPPTDLDTYAERVLETFETPGAAVVIVENGNVVARGYGVRKLGEAARVDADTQFPIGSNTKAMTSTALAILADEGKLDWDDPVIDRLRGFRMSDPYVTRHITVRDLLVHRSGLGLGQGDLLFWPGTNFTRTELVERIGRLPLRNPFRGGYAYDNVLYIVAGEVVAETSGLSWDAFVASRIFKPLGMTRSATSLAGVDPGNSVATHVKTSGPVQGVGAVVAMAKPNDIGNAAAAGAVWSTAADMGHWLDVHMRAGQIGDTQIDLFSAEQSREMWTPQTLIPIAPRRAGPLGETAPDMRAYALGWTVEQYRGRRIVMHTGAVSGGVSITAFLPERNIAFAVLTNGEERGVTGAIFRRLLDHYLGVTPPDWIALLKADRDRALSEAVAGLAPEATSKSGQARGPSLGLAAYAGVYRDDWYGDIAIRPAGRGLEIEFTRTPGMVGALEHVRFDTFRTRWRDRSIEDAHVSFSLNAKGEIESASLTPVSPTADFSFNYHDLLLRPIRDAAASAQ